MAVNVTPLLRRFTIEQYEKMVETGILTQDDRVELIDGEIVEMSPIGIPHVGIVTNLTHQLVGRIGERARVQVQGPVRVLPRSMPQPDLVLLRPRSYMRGRAASADVLLMIEVADTSLQYDRTVKLRLHARAGIPEYWIIDASAGMLEVYRSPSGERYTDHRNFARGESVAPLAFPDAVIPIDAIFA